MEVLTYKEVVGYKYIKRKKLKRHNSQKIRSNIPFSINPIYVKPCHARNTQSTILT